jgi:Calcineurin-like phosphoesterase/Histidine kinase-, DNA gyrase B-, and HSP90-like ATPase
MSDNRPIVWWHFSDLHWEVRASTERRSFLNALFKDLRKRVDHYGPPDFIVISGDISFSGEDAQLLDAEEHFIQPLLEATNNNNIFLFLAAGNHDLRRSSARTINPDLILSINSVKSLNEFLDGEELIDTVKRPFSSFEQFSRRHMPDTEWADLGWWQELDIRGTKLLVVGVNSAWASSYHKDPQGIVDDERHLLLGQKQLQNLIDHSGGTNISLLILHHPFKWLNGFNEPHIKHLINHYADFVLFGHTHTLHDLSLTLSATGTAVYLPAPAIYDRAATDTVEYARGYNIVVFDPIARKGNAYYFKYSDAYATKFTPFVELYSSEDKEGFRIDLPSSKVEASISQNKASITTYSDVLSEYPNLKHLSELIEKGIQANSIERHALEYFEAVILELVRSTDILETDSAEVFWEAVVLTRALIALDLQQLIQAPAKAYRQRFSNDTLVKLLADAKQDPTVVFQLSLDDYKKLFSISIDTFSVGGGSLSQVSELYRRLFSMPWLLSRLLFYCDYPELIPIALASEGRIADLFSNNSPEQLAILGFKFDPVRYLLSIDLRIRDRDGFLAVTMLKHYVDAALHNIADHWRNAQRIFPPITMAMEFPRWRNKQISDYYLSVETTPIVKLLMGKAMYRDAKNVWFRELLQNALDANSARRALDDTSYHSHLEIAYFGGNTCVIRDNGIGMSRQHILRYLTTLGRSIWSSDELHDGKPITRETAIRAIGKFGIGFAAVFQDGSRVLVRTRFFRDVGESGWLVDFSAVDKPFLLEAIDTNIGTEVELQLKEGFSQRAFLNLVNEFFLYIDENVTITPDPVLPKRLSEVHLFPSDLAPRALLRNHLTEEQIDSYRFKLRCLFCYDFKGRDKEEKLPASRLVVANSGVKVFEQNSLILKPGKRYILVTESEDKPRYENPDDSGLRHCWAVVDFEKGASPILPSRLEIEIDQNFSKELLQIIHERFCAGLRSVVKEIESKNLNAKTKRKAILTAMSMSTVEESYYGRRRNQKPNSFSRVKTIDETAVQLYSEHCPIWIQSSDGQDKFETISTLEHSSEFVFVVESVAKSSLFKVYAKAAELNNWVLVEGRREFYLFSKAVNSPDWKGFVSEKDLYSEGRHIFSEVVESRLVDILRGDYALISDDIFGRAAFIVLPSNLPGSWKRGEAAALVRRHSMDSCPARVLVNASHFLISAMSRFLDDDSTLEPQMRLLKLLMDNLCDGVVEQDRITVARGRWKSLNRELRELLPGLPDINYESLVVRR